VTGTSIQVPRVPELSHAGQKSLERFAKSIYQQTLQAATDATAGSATGASVTQLANLITALTARVNALAVAVAALQKATGVPGPQGLPGPFTFLDGENGEDGMPIPGPAGAAGTAGLPGASFFLDPDQGEDGMPIPGLPGAAGSAGAAGPAGAIIFMEADPGEDGMPIPGPPGSASAAASRTFPFFTG
jgi:hypothetical protein